MKTINTITSGGGTHTRWTYDEGEHTQDDLEVANIMIGIRDKNVDEKAAAFDDLLNDVKKTLKKAVKKASKKAVKKALKKSDNQVVATTTTPRNKNYEIAYALLKVSISVSNDDGYYWPRAEVYRDAAEVVSKLDYAVTSGGELASGPKKVRGIGKGVARLVDEYLNSGTMTRTEHKEIEEAVINTKPKCEVEASSEINTQHDTTGYIDLTGVSSEEENIFQAIFTPPNVSDELLLGHGSASEFGSDSDSSALPPLLSDSDWSPEDGGSASELGSDSDSDSDWSSED